MNRVAALATSVLLALVISACDSDSHPEAANPPTNESAESAVPTTPSTSPSSKPTPKAPTYRKVFEATTRSAFVTPSGNITCELADNTARCDITEKSFRTPARPSDCRFDYGNSIYLDSEPEIGCVGDTIAGDASVGEATTSWFHGRAIMIPNASDGFAPLAYGEALKVGSIRCGSAENGVTCENLGNGHGFRLARAEYEFFRNGSGMAHEPAPATSGTQTIGSARFGISAKVPASFACSESANGDGAVCDHNGVSVTLSGSNELDDSIPAPTIQNVTRNLRGLGYDVTYTSGNSGAFSVSGTKAGEIIYRRYLVGAGSSAGLEWIYPSGKKAELDASVTASVKSLKADDLNSAH